MTPPWTVELYENDEGGCPVREFLEALDKPGRAKVVAIIALLAERGPTLPFPYSSQVKGKIRELRTHYGKEHYRVLYSGAPGRAFVLLHVLEKRSEKIPDGDVELAETRRKKHLEQPEHH